MLENLHILVSMDFGGVLFISLFSTYDWTDRKKMTISIIVGVWYAITDEVHQLMVPGRHRFNNRCIYRYIRFYNRCLFNAYMYKTYTNS